MKWPLSPAPPKCHTLQDALTGRLLTGLFIEDNCLHLRFTDAVMTVDLDARTYRYGPQREVWLAFPGWLRIEHVLQDSSQIVLETSGTVYSSRISIRHTQGRWQIFFPSRVV
jgi:hypothetical protein